MKILITGGAGFIGSNLSTFHINNNDEVWVIDNLITGNKQNIISLIPNKNFHFVESDLINFEFINFPTFDIIYHLASPASPPKFKPLALEIATVNSIGTKNILDFMLKSHSHTFILASTSEVYGDPLIHPQSENYYGNVNPLGIRSCYDEGKRFAESLSMIYLHKFKIDVRIARIFNTYGPNMEKDDGRVISNFIDQAITNKDITIYGDGAQTRSFTYVSDMVQGLYLLATSDIASGQVINLGNPDERKIIDLAKIIKDLCHSNSKLVYSSIPQDDPKKRKPDINRAKKIIKWSPEITLEKGLLKTIEYFQKRSL